MSMLSKLYKYISLYIRKFFIFAKPKLKLALKLVKNNQQLFIIGLTAIPVAIIWGLLLYKWINIPRPAVLHQLDNRNAYYFQGSSNLYSVEIGDRKTNEPKVEFSLGNNKSVTFYPASANASIAKPVEKNNTVTFTNVYPNTNYIYKTIPLGIKEDIVVNKPNGISIYPFFLDLKGVTPKYYTSDISGGVFYDEKGNYIFNFKKPFAVDAKGNKSNEVDITIKKDSATGKLVAILGVDPNWLKDPARVYPVSIDPTVVYDTTAKFAAGQLNRVADIGTGYITGATGGTITYSGGYTIHTFTASGTFTPSVTGNVEVLIVGGGGGGGAFGGGGGGGGVIYNSSYAVTTSPITVTVGDGGNGDPTYNSGSTGSKGSDSVFGGITATGGGGGGSRICGAPCTGVAGASGGSGGGGSPADGAPVGAGGPASPVGQGNDGGNGGNFGWGGGGGGGAGAKGAAANLNNGGNGGSGLTFSISGNSAYYGGGGGGCVYNTGTVGSGGTGGGGAGGLLASGVAGTTNTGGGGGGGSAGAYTGGKGGSGIVIVRYPTGPNLNTYYQELPTDQYTADLFHFDETSGNAVDSSGNSNTGTPTGTTVVGGLIGNARSFVTGDYVSHSTAKLNPSAGTVEMWVRPNWNGNDGLVHGLWQNNTTNSDQANSVSLFKYSANQLYWRVMSPTTGYQDCAPDASNFFTSGQWTHVAAAYSSAGTYLYINGNLVCSLANITPPNALPEATARVGFGWANTFGNGVIDEVRISNIARTPEEIKLDAQRRPYSIFTSDVIDLTMAQSWNSLSWSELGVNTGGGETPYSSTNLVAQWNFNATSGTTASNDAGGTSCGGTPANCNGTLTNFATTASQDASPSSGWTANNRRWGAGALTFGSAANNYVTMADNSALDLTSGITINAWINSSSLSSTRTILAKRDVSLAEYNYGFRTNGTELEFYFLGSSATQIITTSGANLKTGQWYFVAVTYDGTSGHIYVNGVEQKSSCTMGTCNVAMTPDNNSLSIGRPGDLNDQYFSGTIDAVSLYSRALPVSEILSDYQAGNIELQTRVGNTANADDGTWEAWKPVTGETQVDSMDTPITNVMDSLISYWKMDEASGTRYDSLGRNNLTANGTGGVGSTTGIINNTATFVSASSQYLSCTDANCGGAVGGKLDFGPTQSFSYSAWVKTTTSGVQRTIMAKKGNVNSNGSVGYSAWVHTTNAFYCSVADGTQSIPVTITGTVNDGNWHLIVCVVDRKSQTIKGYRDGVAGSANWIVNVKTTENATPFTIGSDGNATSAFMDGQIDEAGVWSKALSQADVTALYNAGAPRGLQDVSDVTNMPQNGGLMSSSETTLKLEGSASQEINSGQLQPDGNTLGLWHMDETGGSGAWIKDASGTRVPFATGGTAVISGANTIHTFKSTGSSTLTVNGTGNVEVLVVGGGGSGGGSNSVSIGSGGGGAGGVIYNATYAVTPSAIPVTVGDGGTGVSGFVAGNNGQDSVFGTLTAKGGGYGGTWTVAPTVGGSGGGAGENGQGLVGAAGTAWQGNAGGNQNGYDAGAPSAGGGGGGASTVGADSTTDTIGGTGGDGISTASAFLQAAGAGVNVGGTYWIAGGGGGAGSTTLGTGGKGGGGDGKGVTTGTGNNGTANTGGGGGGSLTNASEAAQPGGNGGSGIVIVRYPASQSPATVYANAQPGGGVTSDNGIVGRSLHFDGTTGAFIYAYPTSQFDVPVGGNFSAETWIKTSTNGEQIYYNQGAPGGNSIIMMSVGTTLGGGGTANKFVVFFRDTAANSLGALSGTTTVADGKWHHLAVTVTTSGASRTITQYVDGIVDATNTWSSNGAITSTTGTLYIGGVGGSYNFNGNIDEFRISNVARSPEEIAEDYRAGANHYITKTISTTDLYGKTSLPFYVASDRQGTFLSAVIGESAFANYQPDANTVGLWHLEENDQEASPSILQMSSTNVAAANAYTYVKTLSASATVATGDTFEYDVFLGTNTIQTGGVDIAYVGGTYARSTGWVDQNSLGCTGGDITPQAYGKWYHRKCTILAGDNGKVMSYVDLVNENDTATATTAYFDNVNLFSSTGVLKQAIYSSGAPGFNTIDIESNAGNTGSSTNITNGPRIWKEKDVSGNGNDGIPFGTTFTQGKIGKARSFNGTTDLIGIPHSTSLNLSTAITIDAWVYPTTSKYNMIVSKANNGDGVDDLYFAIQSSGCSTGQLSLYWSASGWICGTSAVPLNTWSYVALTWDGSNVKYYINGILDKTAALSGARTTNTDSVRIGSYVNGVDGTNFSGSIDEVRISNTARTADQIRQAYEIGTRTHTITIDFKAALDAGNLIANTSDLGFTIDATKYGGINMGSNLYLGDKIIVEENFNGTTYIAQGTVNSINISTGAVTVAAWDAGSTVPAAGFTVNATVFKWQREYFDIRGSRCTADTDVACDIYATTNLTLRLTDGSQGANIWLDDLRSNSGNLTTPGGSTITSSTHDRYFQYRSVLTSYDTAVSPSLTGVTLDYVQNTPPAIPSLDLPTDTAAELTRVPVLKTTTSDANLDYMLYKIQICKDLAMTLSCQTITQPSTYPETGWTGQDAQWDGSHFTAYASGTQGIYTIQTSGKLDPGVTYYWRSYAIDPGGVNTWGATQATPYSFTTASIPNIPTSLLTQDASNPTGITTGTPYFSALCNSPDVGDTLTKYQIQVSTNPTFSSTVWDSGSTSMTPCASGARSANLTFGGTALPLDGSKYYWRIKFWDAVDNESSFSNSLDLFVMANAITGILNSTSCLVEETPNDSSLTLVWVNGSTTETQFRIEKNIDSGGFSFLANESPGVFTYPDSSISSGHTYQYRVRAEGISNSDWCTTNTLSLQLGDFNLKGLNLKGLNIQ